MYKGIDHPVEFMELTMAAISNVITEMHLNQVLSDVVRASH